MLVDNACVEQSVDEFERRAYPVLTRGAFRHKITGSSAR